MVEEFSSISAVSAVYIPANNASTWLFRYPSPSVEFVPLPKVSVGSVHAVNASIIAKTRRSANVFLKDFIRITPLSKYKSFYNKKQKKYLKQNK